MVRFQTHEQKKKGNQRRSAGERILRLTELLRGKKWYRNSRAASEIQTLYPGKEGIRRLRSYYSRKMEIIAALLLAGLILGASLLAKEYFHSDELEEVRRNPYGEEESEMTLSAVGRDGAEDEITVYVSARQYTKEETDEYLRLAEQELEKKALLENSDWDHVTGDLFFPASLPGNPVQIQWGSDHYALIGTDGVLHADHLETESEKVEIRARLTLQGEERIFRKTAVVRLPELTADERRRQNVIESIREADDGTVTQEYLPLPKEAGDRQISWHRKRNNSGFFVMAFACLAAFLISLSQDSRLHNNAKKRREQMEIDYAEILNKFVLLMGAGMTVRSAWERITADYVRFRKGKRYAYEEMLLTNNEIQSGVSEVKAYENFGNRCAVPSYIKLGALLAQNLRKGNKDLLKLFRREMAEAAEGRKQLARKRGEEAGTKILIPMILMLADVLIIVLFPALMSMR